MKGGENMSKKIIYIATIACLFGVSFSVSVFAQEMMSRGEQHRSDVGEVVEELMKVAKSDDRIGNEVKTVAQEEQNASTTVKDKMEKIENRSAWKTFLIGSDYKNLGALRSTLVTTQNHLDRLNKALDKTTSTTVKNELEAQIKQLETVKVKAENFIKDNESKFSLFGWLVKLFSK